MAEFYAGGAYRRAAAQHAVGPWARTLRGAGLFRPVGYCAERHPVPMGSAGQLAEMLACQPGVAAALRAHRTEEDFAADVAALAEWRYGAGPLVLPLETKLFVLEKAAPAACQ